MNEIVLQLLAGILVDIAQNRIFLQGLFDMVLFLNRPVVHPPAFAYVEGYYFSPSKKKWVSQSKLFVHAETGERMLSNFWVNDLLPEVTAMEYYLYSLVDDLILNAVTYRNDLASILITSASTVEAESQAFIDIFMRYAQSERRVTFPTTTIFERDPEDAVRFKWRQKWFHSYLRKGFSLNRYPVPYLEPQHHLVNSKYLLGEFSDDFVTVSLDLIEAESVDIDQLLDEQYYFAE